MATTISSSVQSLLAKLKVGAEADMTAEELLLLSKSVQALADNEDFEQALIAVAEGHLDTATSAVSAATVAAQTASSQLQQNATSLDLIPQMQNELTGSVTQLNSDVQAKINNIPGIMGSPLNKIGEPHFILDYYDSSSFTLSDSVTSYGAYNTISLVDYLTGEFYAYWDAGSQTDTNTRATLLKIDSKGQVSQANSATRLLGTNSVDHIMLLRLNDGSVRAATYTTSSKSLALYQNMNFTTEVAHALDYFKLYQDPATHLIYGVNAGILHVLSSNGWQQVTDTSFLTESSFDTWAQQRDYGALHDLKITPVNSHQHITSATGGTNSHAYLPTTRPTQLMELAYDNKGAQSVTYTTAPNLACAEMEEFNGGTGIYNRSFRSRIKLKAKDNFYSAMLESRTPNNGYKAVAQYYPRLVVHSPIHRALVVQQYFNFYTSSTTRPTYSLSRVYFA
ncbi:hypothetical protein [Thalassomonas actiniarum]|uniref:Uncharacterized protein n=1 Tax=Thalassomonas actiniarum TaxID=485447 RepID=A0AAE9YRQ9_9GAMM|nr:hypothetical protein [Thalassomonas actiniarum]WDD98366.1 hypothetical protein SG35_024360 [Thalassomonas actiniarum]